MEGARSAGPRPIHTAPLLWLAALVLGVAALLLEPLAHSPIFGSDSGEYYALTQSIALTGHLPLTYSGWGSAYPDFPGTFVLTDALAGAAGSGVFAALTVGLPVVAALSVLPLFLLFRRVFPNDTVAILGAALGSVAFPRVFSLAHPAPLALGDVLVVATLWMFLEGRTDRRWYLPMALTASALVVTHHLSSFFFVVSALGTLLLAELSVPGLWARRFPGRELAFLGTFLAGMFAFWSYEASFLTTVLGSSFTPGPRTVVAFEAAAIGGIVLIGLAIRWRRSRVRRPIRLRFPSDRSVLRDALLLVLGVFGGVLLLVTVPLPGTSQTTTASAVLFFSPILALVALASGSRRLVTASRLGPLTLTWLAAIGLSALAAIALDDPVISPARHPEYLVIPLALLVAVALGRWIGRAGDRWGRPAIVAGVAGALLLIGANAAIAYPPPSDLGGFQEGITPSDSAMLAWSSSNLPEGATIASDHRLSSMLFGFGGFYATWDSTPALFTGTNRSEALAELSGSLAPHQIRAIDAVAIDATMRSGVALDPSALAVPMSAAAIAWLSNAPFVPLYENGPQVVYWVAGPVGPGP